MGFITHHEEEWQLVGDRVRTVIVGEFYEGNVLCPGSSIGTTEDPEIGFYFLVNLFCFSISLRVIGSGKGKFIAKKFSQFFGKGGSELWSVIRDDLVIKAEPFEDFGEE